MNERNRGLLTLVTAVAAVLIAIAALGRPISINVQGGDGPGGRVVGLTATGEGVVHAVPDLAYLDFGVQGTGGSVKVARSEAAAAADRVLTALRAAGITDADVRTTSLSLYPTYPSYPCPLYSTPDRPVEPAVGLPVSTPGEGNSGSGSGVTEPGKPDLAPYCDPSQPQIPNGWNYSQSFEVTVRDVDAAGEILDSATAAGVTQISGIRFDLDNRDALLAQARDSAIKAARAKAEATAEAAGVDLGAILSIAETSNSPYPGPWYGAKDEAAGGTTPVAPGTMDVTVTVSVSFALGN